MNMHQIPTVMLSAILSCTGTATAETLQVTTVATAPAVDGKLEALWDAVPELAIPLYTVPAAVVTTNRSQATGKYASKWQTDQPASVNELRLKAVRFEDRVYFSAQWRDSSQDDQHKPWRWQGDKKSGEYMTGKEREDRIALMFPISGTFSPNKLSGDTMSVDVWHWKAARTNPIGLAHDKRHLVSKDKPTGKAAAHLTAGGETVYLSRPGDGPSPYTTKNIDPFVYQGDALPKYLPKRPDHADAVDVAAKGKWSDGEWVVEFERKLDTGHGDTDTVFVPGTDTRLAVAVFDHVGDHYHVVSDAVNVSIE